MVVSLTRRPIKFNSYISIDKIFVKVRAAAGVGMRFTAACAIDTPKSHVLFKIHSFD